MDWLNTFYVCVIILLIVIVFQNMVTLRAVKKNEELYNSVKFQLGLFHENNKLK